MPDLLHASAWRNEQPSIIKTMLGLLYPNTSRVKCPDLEHDDDVALVEDVAGRVHGHSGEMLDLLRIPDPIKPYKLMS